MNVGNDVKAKGITFSEPMVRAILSGAKTMTRRVAKPKHEDGAIVDAAPNGNAVEAYGGGARHIASRMQVLHCPFGSPGDLLYVKETWCPLDFDHFHDRGKPSDSIVRYGSKTTINGAAFAAECVTEDSERCRKELGYKWKSSRFMPKKLARLWLRITNVRVERLQDITTQDAIAEGIDSDGGDDEHRNRSTVENFAALWDSLHAKDGHGWESNCWVWVLSFQRIERPTD